MISKYLPKSISKQTNNFQINTNRILLDSSIENDLKPLTELLDEPNYNNNQNEISVDQIIKQLLGLSSQVSPLSKDLNFQKVSHSNIDRISELNKIKGRYWLIYKY